VNPGNVVTPGVPEIVAVPFPLSTSRSPFGSPVSFITGGTVLQVVTRKDVMLVRR